MDDRLGQRGTVDGTVSAAEERDGSAWGGGEGGVLRVACCVGRPSRKEVVGLEEEGGGEGELIEAVAGEGARDGESRAAQGQGGQVELGLALMGEADVDFDEELAAGQGAALAEARPGEEGGGEGDPGEALSFGEGAPALGDGGKEVADCGLCG